MPSASSLFLDQALSCARPLPSGLVLEPNGAFVYNSCRRNRRTGKFLEGTGVPSLSPTEEQDSKSFQELIEWYIPDLHDHLSFASRQWDKRIAGIEIIVGRPIQVCLVNGSMFEINLILSATYLLEIVSSVKWDRIMDSHSCMVSGGLHRITWHPYNRLSFRLGRRRANLECRRVVETVCSQWLHDKRKSLGIVGSQGKTMALRQLLTTLIEYHSKYRVGVLSETGELHGMEGVTDIPLQRNWIEAIQLSNIQILIVDCVVDYDKLANLGGGILVAGSGWQNADLLLEIQNKAPWYRLNRRNKKN